MNIGFFPQGFFPATMFTENFWPIRLNAPAGVAEAGKCGVALSLSNGLSV